MTKREDTVAALKVAAQGLAAGKRKGDRAHPTVRTPGFAPVPEQAGGFTTRPVTVKTEKGQTAGRAYRREPYFETLAKRPFDKDDTDGRRLISEAQLRALRYYRDRWEACQHSETRCALDVGTGGGTRGPREPVAIVMSYAVEACDKAMGAIGDTMRAVALRDHSFASAAIERWGSRERQRVVLGVGKQKPRIVNEIVPKSSEHATTIREEFLAALKILTRTVEGMSSGSG